jgi:hypothetical protein
MNSMTSHKYAKKVNILITCFFLLTLLFPALVVNKLFFLAIMLMIGLNLSLYRLNTYSPFIIFFVFLFGFIHSFFFDVDFSLSLQFFFAQLVLFLIYPVIKYEIDIDRIARVSGIVMASYTIISFLIITVFISLPFAAFYNNVIFEQFSAGSNGIRDFVEGGTISFHIGTLPFLYLSLVLYVVYFIEKKKASSLLAIILLFSVIFMSASRGTLLISVLGIMFIIFYKANLKAKFALFSVIVPLLIIVASYLLTSTTIFDSEEQSNNVKIGHFESFIENIDAYNFFFGSGLGSYYYSKGSQAMKAHTEITPLDMLRYLGFILTPILYFFIFFPTKRIKPYLNNQLYFVLFTVYVVNSFTNPTMFNSYGLLIVIWYWSKVLKGNDSVPQKRIALYES